MRRLLLLVAAIVFVDTMFFAALTPLLPQYADRLDLSKSSAGVLAAAYAAGALAGALPGGIAAARLGVKPAVLLGLGGMGATTLTFGVADSEWLLDSSRFLQGFSSSFSWTGALAWLVGAAPPERRGELIGAAMGAAIFGALFGPVLGGIASVVGTGVAFGSVALLAAALAAWAQSTPSARPQPRQPVRRLFAALLDPRVAIGAWFVLLPALLFGVLSVLAPLRLDALGLGSVAIGATFLIGAAAEGAAAPLLGRLSDRRGRLLPLRAGLVASAAVAATIPWVGHRWTVAALVVAAAVAYGSFWAPGMSLLADGADAIGLDQAYAFALLTIAWAPGAAGGAAAGGAVAETVGDAAPYLVLATLCVLTLPLAAPRRLAT